MAIKYGFYNSISGDRKYNAEDFGRIFDGIIRDGVFESIYDKFQITILPGLSVSVGKGKAWFNNTWLENDANYPVSFTEAEVLLNRIDAVVMEFNSTEGVRANSIKVITGTPSSTPQKPTLTHTDTVNQYPLCYVTIPAKATSLVAGNLDIRIGSTDCPYVVIQSGEIPSLTEINKLIEDAENLSNRIDETVDGLSYLKTNGDGTRVLADDGIYRSLTPVLLDTLTTSGTFNPANYGDGTYLRFIFILYGGGGGGGVSEHIAFEYVDSGTWDYFNGMGGGGGSGGKTKTAATSVTQPVTYVIGAKGNGGWSPTDGGDTKILNYTAGGGKKGTNGEVTTPGFSETDGDGGAAGAGTTANGQPGAPGGSGSWGARGGSSDMGQGGKQESTESASTPNATGYGAGGAGGRYITYPTKTKQVTYGGNGSPGVIFVYGIQFITEAGV